MHNLEDIFVRKNVFLHTNLYISTIFSYLGYYRGKVLKILCELSKMVSCMYKFSLRVRSLQIRVNVVFIKKLIFLLNYTFVL